MEYNTWNCAKSNHHLNKILRNKGDTVLNFSLPVIVAIASSLPHSKPETPML